ncbi:hypothetical protein FKR81_38545 [Lentzea tibetensis]|uniref:PLAT domain-containing protein n=1 Tax=Lentzea tibetensis TaxID=2591470 RepID=A0A563EIJ1_9PSEU|nr:PLAT/LH2 domain-containing protein [Lentzea tibetensis]TWP45734.1 hypothetical protein FKR81_38545 [Lentzea tibetensis]
MKIRSVLLTAALAMIASLAAIVPSASADGISTFYVTIRTADLPDAGTEDHVRLTMFGPNGACGPFQFDKDFHRGDTWVSGKLKCPNIGTPSWISLGKGGGHKDAWYAEYVHIYEEGPGTNVHCEVNYLYPKSSETKFWGCSQI